MLLIIGVVGVVFLRVKCNAIGSFAVMSLRGGRGVAFALGGGRSSAGIWIGKFILLAGRSSGGIVGMGWSR